MNFDYVAYRKAIRSFLETQDGKKFLNEWFPSVFSEICVAILVFIFGLFFLFTILLTRLGWEMVTGSLKALFTGDVFTNRRKRLSEEPERVVPILAPCVLSGPSGHSVVLSSFDPRIQEDLHFLGNIAKELAELYENGCSSPEQQKMYDIIHDDIYESGRRQYIAEPFNSGQKVVMFDIELEEREIAEVDGVACIACIATFDKKPGEFDPKADKQIPPEGDIKQLPWNMAEKFVSR